MSRWFESKEFALVAALAIVILGAKFWTEIESAAAASVASLRAAVESLRANAESSPPVAEQVILQSIAERHCFRPAHYVITIPREAECRVSHCH